MRAVSEPYGIPEAAVRAVIAGTDLLCLGRDQDQRRYLAVKARARGGGAVRHGCLASGWRRPRRRVAELRAWTARGGRPRAGAAAPTAPPLTASLRRPRAGAPIGAGGGPAGRPGSGTPPAAAPTRSSVQLVPPSNIAVGACPGA